MATSGLLTARAIRRQVRDVEAAEPVVEPLQPVVEPLQPAVEPPRPAVGAEAAAQPPTGARPAVAVPAEPMRQQARDAADAGLTRRLVPRAVDAAPLQEDAAQLRP